MDGGTPGTKQHTQAQGGPGTAVLAVWLLGLLVGWIVYSTLGIALGVAVITLAAGFLGINNVPFPLLVAFASIAGGVGGALSGLAAGTLQGRALKRLLPTLELTRWTWQTAAGWALGWACVWVLAELVPEFGELGTHYGIVSLDYAVGGVVSWAIAGAWIGFCQWGTLRYYTKQSGWWIPFTTVAWCAGAITCWLVGAALGAGQRMYWSFGLFLSAPDLAAPGVISSVLGWLAAGALTALGLRWLLARDNRVAPRSPRSSRAQD